MKITAIKAQVKRQDRYSVYVDGTYSFSLSEGQLVACGLHSGQELDADELAKYRDESAEGKLFDRLLNLLSYRIRSEWEVRDYLRRKRTPAEQADRLARRLVGLGYVNDQKFAQSWVESRRTSRSASQRKLRAELAAKRIAADIIDQALAADETNERDVLDQLVRKKRARYSDDTKLMQYLARQGFSYGDIRDALAQAD